jgi:hypothetical protein
VGGFLLLDALDNLLINLDILLKGLRLLLFAVSGVLLLELFLLLLVESSLLGQVGVHLVVRLLGVLALHRWLLHYMPFFLGIDCFLPLAARSIFKSGASILPLFPATAAIFFCLGESFFITSSPS